MRPPWEREPLGKLLYPLSLLYGLGVRADGWLWQRGLRRKGRLPGKVISVGNITVGGSGKTPMVMAIARFLRDRGHKVAVLSRGYGGKAERTGAVVSDGERILVGPEVSGDEPYLMAQALPGVVVAVGRDRVRMGQEVRGLYGVEVFVLDDAFQYRGVHRDVDLVCLDPDTDLDSPRLLPSGPFREPPGALLRASGIVITYWEPTGEAMELKERLISLGKPLFVATATYEGLVGDEALPLEALRGRRVAVLLGIAKPGRFLAAIRGLGLEVCRCLIRGDHHRWSEEEVREASEGAEAILTTEKDLVRLPPVGVPRYALRVALRPEDALWDFLLGALSG